MTNLILHILYMGLTVFIVGVCAFILGSTRGAEAVIKELASRQRKCTSCGKVFSGSYCSHCGSGPQ